jgi:hypothetical protein
MDPTVTGTELDETLIGRWCTRIRYWQVLTKMDPLLTGTDPDVTHYQTVHQDPVLAGFDQDGSPIDRY